MSTHRYPRVRAKHPEQRQAELRQKAVERSIKLAQTSWRWPYGWLLLLWATNGSVHRRDARSYAEAIAMRAEEMEDGYYEKAWISMKTA